MMKLIGPPKTAPVIHRVLLCIIHSLDYLYLTIDVFLNFLSSMFEFKVKIIEVHKVCIHSTCKHLMFFFLGCRFFFAVSFR